jgi:serine/threonine protein kinase
LCLASELSDPLIGTLFADKYDILSLLGEGGMSRVYKARHRFMKRIVAVKLLHESATKDPTAKARFQQEAEAASALNHQNVVTVHDFGFTPSGQAFFVMDCLEGKTLEQLLEESGGPLPIAQAIDIFAQACDGLDHAHRKGIVHRDIKPSNLVIIKQEDGSDLVKIVDFGIAKVLTPAPDGEKQRQLTQAGEVFGTPAYMSPEQCSGEPLDGRSDIYSFGCLMYEALSGILPLVGETFINTVVKHINERPKSFAEVNPQAKVPPHVEAVVMRCLEKDPKARYASALELKQALFDAAYASGVKGLRFGAVPDPNQTKPHQTVAKNQTMSTSLSVMMVTKKWRLSFQVMIALILSAFGALALFFFVYPGPEGDKGTLINKLLWQRDLSTADDLARQQKYDEEVKVLLKAVDISKNFGDGESRLELTLNKLGEAYGSVHDYSNQELVNKQLVDILAKRALKEYEGLMNSLSEWDKPSSSSTKRQELALQATAFGDRILACANKLSIKRKEREELLLKKAIKVFDAMEAGDWKFPVRFAVALAESYHTQQRFDDERKILDNALKKCPAQPNSPEGWRAKVQAIMHLGQLDRNLAIHDEQLDHARKELESALSWTKEHLADDKDTLKESLNSMVIMERLYHTKEHDEKAQVYEKEARALE